MDMVVVLANIFKGDQSSFVRQDEVIAAWEIFTPYVPSSRLFHRHAVESSASIMVCDRLLKYIEAEDGPTPTLYPYGSAGPEEQYALEEKYGLASTRGC